MIKIYESPVRVDSNGMVVNPEVIIDPAKVIHSHPHGPLCSPEWCGGGKKL